MDIFLVGGAVRDELLGRPVKERDWVVVGSTPEEMIARKFQPVGKDFPVFLHPKTHEEYALARTERKTGKGYKGFHFYATPDVSLTEDLRRRDLTINAIAKSSTGELIDPYHGQADIKKRILRHVSPAFSEDPVRILRIARFACQLVNFQVHPDTNTLMQDMVKTGEVDALVPERVWKELSRALAAEKPVRFFEVLQQCHALPRLFPELTPGDAGMHALLTACTLSDVGAVRFATLCHHLSPKMLKTLCQRYRVASDYAELAMLVMKYNVTYHALNTQSAADLLQLLKAADAFRRPERFAQLITACRATKTQAKDHTILLTNALKAAKAVDTTPLVKENLQGLAFAKALQQRQVAAIAAMLGNAPKQQ